MLHRKIVWLLGAGLLAGAVFAAEPKNCRAKTRIRSISFARLFNRLRRWRSLAGNYFSIRACRRRARSPARPVTARTMPMVRRTMAGGARWPRLDDPGARAVPSLTYLERQPDFSIGPDDNENENVSLAQKAEVGQSAERVQKTATQAAQTRRILFRRGACSGTGAPIPFRSRRRSAARSTRGRLQRGDHRRKTPYAPYARKFAALFGANIFRNSKLLVSEAMFAVGRYQIEEPSFHPYTSKYDYWLEGRARLSESEMRGLRCSTIRRKPTAPAAMVRRPPTKVLPPPFTDTQYEALGCAAQCGAGRYRRSRLFRSRGLRTHSQGRCRANAILRHVQDADPSQHRRAPRVLPQWRIPDLAAGDGFLQFPRYQSGEGLSA